MKKKMLFTLALALASTGALADRMTFAEMQDRMASTAGIIRYQVGDRFVTVDNAAGVVNDTGIVRATRIVIKDGLTYLVADQR